MIIELLPSPPDTRLTNCLIKVRDDETAPLFIGDDDVVMCRLDRYAIIPIEEYEQLVK